MKQLTITFITMFFELATLTPQQIARKAKSRNKWVRGGIANREDVSTGTINLLALDKEPIVVRQAMWNTKVATDTLDTVAKKYKPLTKTTQKQHLVNDIIYAIAEHPNVSAKTFWFIHKDTKKVDNRYLKNRLNEFSLAELKDLLSSLGVQDEEILETTDEDEISSYLLSM